MNTKPFKDVYLYDVTEISSRLEKESLILTPNQRISYHILKRLNAENASNKAWEAPNCLPWLTWVKEIWNSLQDSGYLETPFRYLDNDLEQSLWQKVLEKCLTNTLISANQASKQIQQAHNWCVHWQLDWKSDVFGHQIEHKLFQNCCEAFYEEVSANNFVTTTLIEQELPKSFKKLKPILPKRLLLADFGEFSPLQQEILSVLQQLGTEIIHLEKRFAPNKMQIVLDNPLAEIKTAAAWAKNIVAKDENAVVALIWPNLASERIKIARELSRELEPQASSPNEQRSAPLFNMSAGQALSEVPIVSTAILALKLNNGVLSQANWGGLLLSPYLSSETEYQQKVLLDVAIHELQKPEISLSKVLTLFGSDEFSKTATKTAESLRLFEKVKQEKGIGRHKKASVWREIFLEQLKALSWPGDRQLDSFEYQAVRIFNDTLAGLKRFDDVLEEISCAEALATLQTLCQNTSFQVETKDSPIQVLGLLEAAGLNFTHMWVMGLDDQSWPPAPSPSPFIPYSVQRDKNMPHASAAREFYFARNVMKQFESNVQHIIYSSAEFDGDRELGASPLLDGIAKLSLDAFAAFKPNKIYQNIDLVALNDNSGTVLPFEEARGGSAILKKQSACPFKAFAELRLTALPVPEIVEGLDPRVRGQVIHLALENIWRSLNTQEDLINLGEEQLAQLVDTSIVNSLDEYLETTSLIKNGRLYLNEFSCIQSLIREWLALEAQRAEFAIHALEQRNEIDVNGLQLRVQADRIDVLEDGSQLVVDYKTGAHVSPKQWLGDRPEEPQLPLYSSIDGLNTSALAFGQLNVNGVGFAGLAEKQDVAPGIVALEKADSRLELPESWEVQLQEWREVIAKLVNEYKAGFAAVSPRGPEVCRTCQLQPFCRVNSSIK